MATTQREQSTQQNASSLVAIKSCVFYKRLILCFASGDRVTVLDLVQVYLLNDMLVLYSPGILPSIKVTDMFASTPHPTGREDLRHDVITIHQDSLEFHVKVWLTRSP